MAPMEITLDNISFAYAAAKVLKSISCCFSPGRFYSVIGPNGSGKTTLLDLISGFLPPSEGAITLGDKSLGSISKNHLARQIALVSQDHSINFPFRVEDVILMGRHPYIPRFSQPGPEDLEMVRQVMDSCGIDHLAQRPVNELSGGERQRCIFARALCQDTPVLLLDEAFSNMDIHHTLQLLSLVRAAVKKQNKTVISVFHDLNLASGWSDSILMLKRGKVEAFGDAQSVMTPDNIQRVFSVPAIVEFNQHVKAKQVYYPST